MPAPGLPSGVCPDTFAQKSQKEMGIFSAGQRASGSRADEAAGPAGAGGSGGGSEASASSGPSRTPSASGASEGQVVLSEDALKAAEAAGRGAGDAEATAVRDETYLEDVSVYKLFAFQAVGMPERRVCGLAAPHNFLRFAVFCFYFLGVVAVQALTPAALFGESSAVAPLWGARIGLTDDESQPVPE